MYPLGPLPWSLANTDGGLRTTDKAKLARHLEKRVAPPKAITEPSASVIDAMSILHKTTAKHHIFFVSKMLFNSILQTASQSDRIDVLFDTYCDESIKNPTRDARIRGEQVALNNITAGQKVQHWQDILETLASKRALITFFSDEWQGVYYMQKLSKGSKICGDGASQCAELMYSQEEADASNSSHQLCFPRPSNSHYHNRGHRCVCASPWTPQAYHSQPVHSMWQTELCKIH